ncbi:MAG: nuclear transport factor 2 family protein [Pseudomonadota bacterium]|nr:nuclear transport factor 2 family protein [Pseudomonadota bacterium]MEE2870070.1 nuclear transport factor 2 family protein [Pseudomonadota bacterium]
MVLPDMQHGGFSEERFQQAIAQPRLQGDVPEYLPGNRGFGQVRTLQEAELRAMTQQWFADFESKIVFYRDHGLEIGWMMEWAKKYWWSWLMRDMSLNHELYTDDLEYLDPTTFGRTIKGLEEFVDYNFSFFDAIPDWRYDPIPGEVYVDVAANGEQRILVRYYGSGHFSGALKFYPYDDSAPVLYGNGTFVQCRAVDRYHFNKEGKMYFGETLWDFLDAAQSAGIMPSDNSWTFKALMGASKVQRSVSNLRKRFS